MSNIMDESHKGRDPAYEGTVMEIAGKMAPDRAMGFCVPATLIEAPLEHQQRLQKGKEKRGK